MLFTKSRFQELIKTRQHDEEFLQALTRILFFSTLLVLLGNIYSSYLDQTRIQVGIATFTLFLILHSSWVIAKPGKIIFRRIVAIIADLGFVSFLTYSMGMNAIVLYPVLIWIIMGNGIRFGDFYFYTALGIALVFLSTAIYFNPFWSKHIDFGAALIVGLVLITLLNKKTLKRINLIHKTLDSKLQHHIGELVNE
jgi:two-component system sensor histidine kinase RpfC